MKKMERVAAGGGSAKKKNTERSIEPPSGKANWLMVRAPHLKQRDAEWSATTGTTKVVGGAMADGRESGAPEGPSPEHEPPPVFCLLFSLSRQAPPSGDSGDLGQKGGTAWGGWDAGRARGTSTLVLRPRSPPRRRRRRRLELSLSFFFSMARVTDPLSNLALAFRIGSELGRAVPRSFRERNWNPRLLFDRRLPLRGDGAKGRAQRLA